MCLGEIVRLESLDGPTATARLGERDLTVSLVTLGEPVAVGDWVLTHSGFALRRLDPDEAAAALSLRTAPHNLKVYNSPIGASSNEIFFANFLSKTSFTSLKSKYIFVCSFIVSLVSGK